jgi:hypothetical protein
MPGNGGLALHTIVLDPANSQRMYVAISSGGVYRTEDGGSTWTSQNQGIRVMFMPDKYPEFGQCVHKIALHPDRPERLFLQNHWGLYRSDNRGEKWTDIANGVPSDFGFSVIMHPRNPDCVYIIPVESDEFRCACDGRVASVSNPQRGCLVGASRAWPAPKRRLRNCPEGCDDSRFIRPSRHLLRHTEWAALWLAR